MKTRKILKNLFLIFFTIGLFLIIFLVGYLSLIYFSTSVKFDKDKITNSKLSINLYDNQKLPISNTSLNGQFIPLPLIPKHTKQCFISIEDKDFYKHNGLNYKRMLVATVKNIISLSFKEGASTISQQLIKNTHLSREKTVNRKIAEIKLTKTLEKELTKDEILEYYLNVIYFGDNCYGLQDASIHYFSHSATKLDINESAMLAGMIKSPNKFHPVKNYTNCIKRKNLVLGEMYKDGNITKDCYYENTKKSPSICINENSLKRIAYCDCAIKEAEDVLKLPEKNIAIGGYKIYTYLDKNKQQHLLESVPNTTYNYCMISMNATNGHIEAYAQNADYNIINIKRQPASAIKPSLVYAPAINENIISPSTIILDEDISINGYSPKNIGGKNYGYVSAKNALVNSYNIPAVKILSYVGINKAKSYLARQNISFNDNDDNLAIALGGLTDGISLKQLTNTYQTLANGGYFVEAKFIEYITDKNGKIIYKNDEISKNIYRDDTAYLVTDMLLECAKTGTAKMLKTLNYDVASKTGTSSNMKENLDAYNISYTSKDVIGVWIGNLDNSPIDIAGGGLPTLCVKSYFEKLYKTYKPSPFKIPSSVCEIDIDLLALEDEHIVYEASEFLPERYKAKRLFSRFNLPTKNYYNNLTMPQLNLSGTAKNGIANISFETKENFVYQVYKTVDGFKELVDEISCSKGIKNLSYYIGNNKCTDFTVDVNIKNSNNKKMIEVTSSNTITLICN